MSLFCGLSILLIGFPFVNEVKNKEPLLADKTTITTYDGDDVNVEVTIQTEKPREVYLNPFQMILTVDFWLLFILLFAGIGTGLVVINNMGNMVQSYRGEKHMTGILVIIFSVFNCIGRILFGYLSDKLKNYITRTGFLNITVLMMALSQYCWAFVTLPLFYPLVILT
ncbi:3 TM domain-containing transmembrane protein, partial [Acrasis kona]